MREVHGTCRIARIHTGEYRGIDGVSFLLCFRLVQTQSAEGPIYSFFVSKDIRGRVVEENFIYDFTRDGAFAEKTFEKLVRGAVTPAALEDVIEELLP